MTTLFKISFGLIALSMTFLSSCKKDDPVIPNEEEIITTLIYTLTPTTGGTPVTMTFQDLDGDGGNEPTITGGTLDANTNYEGHLQLLNETVSPEINISSEVSEEDTDHQFFFNIAGNLDLSLAYDDQDSAGNPLGLSTLIDAGDISQGQMTIILRHEPDKSAAGVASGDVTNAGGETDIEVTFDINIQ